MVCHSPEMQDHEQHRRESPWRVERVELNLKTGEVQFYLVSQRSGDPAESCH